MQDRSQATVSSEDRRKDGALLRSFKTGGGRVNIVFTLVAKEGISVRMVNRAGANEE
jgi:hypothetical protein